MTSFGSNKMVDLADAIKVVNALVVRLDSLTDASDQYWGHNFEA